MLSNPKQAFSEGLLSTTNIFMVFFVRVPGYSGWYKNEEGYDKPNVMLNYVNITVRACICNLHAER